MQAKYYCRSILKHRLFKVRFQTIVGHLRSQPYKSKMVCADCASDAEFAVSRELGDTSYDIDAVEV